MNYQRILMLTDLGADPQPACEAIRRFAPSATQVTVIAQQPPRLFAWVTPAAPPDLNDAARRTLDDLRQAAEGTAAAVNVALESELTAEALADAVATYDIDLVVVGSLPLRTLSMVAELRKRSARAGAVCSSRRPASSGPEGGNRMLCVGLSREGASRGDRDSSGTRRPAGSSRAPVVSNRCRPRTCSGCVRYRASLQR